MAAFTPIILVHLVTAVGALLFGGIALAAKKGSRLHKLAGRIWVMLMLTTALVSFGIRIHGSFSVIHILSVVTLLSVTAGLYAAARGRISAHRRGMRGAYVGLVIAGVFTLLPGRRLGDLLWNAVGFV